MYPLSNCIVWIIALLNYNLAYPSWLVIYYNNRDDIWIQIDFLLDWNGPAFGPVWLKSPAPTRVCAIMYLGEPFIQFLSCFCSCAPSWLPWKLSWILLESFDLYSKPINLCLKDIPQPLLLPIAVKELCLFGQRGEGPTPLWFGVNLTQYYAQQD